MSEIKYTTDGRKVVVIGALNAQEKIVQEIFVTKDGAELPGGENFVVKSLLDQPAESWQSKRARETEEKYLAQKAAIEKGEAELREKEEVVMKPLREKIRILKLMEKEIHPEALRLLSDFLFGKLKYAVYSDYSPKIEEFAPENHSMTESGYSTRVRFEKLRLISLMGSTDGKLDWRIHTYSDFSGGGRDVFLVATLEEAKEKLIDAFSSKNTYGDDDLAELSKWGIEPDPQKLEATKAARIKLADDMIARSKAEIEKYEAAKKTASKL